MSKLNKIEKKGNGKLYCIKSYQTDKIYVGSTFQNYLSDRMSGHRKQYRQHKIGKQIYVTSFELLKYDDCYIELISKHNDVTKSELFKLEGEYIKQNKDICVNKVIAGRSSVEYRNETKEQKHDYDRNFYINHRKLKIKISKQYYDDNIDKIKEYKSQKFECECGGRYTLTHKACHLKSKKHQSFLQ